jgi:hypothetical protein
VKLDEASLMILKHVFNATKIDFGNLTNFTKEKTERILSGLDLTLAEFAQTDSFSDNFKGQLILQFVKEGIEVENILDNLDWKGFEIIVSNVFDKMGSTVIQNFRFKDETTKYEVDVIAFKFPYIYIIDCKHYKTPNKSSMKIAVDKQKERTEVLLEEFPILYDDIVSKLQLPLKREIFLYPMIISWRNHDIQIYQDVPIVAFSQLQGFIQEIDEIRFNLFHLTLKLD